MKKEKMTPKQIAERLEQLEQHFKENGVCRALLTFTERKNDISYVVRYNGLKIGYSNHPTALMIDMENNPNSSHYNEIANHIRNAIDCQKEYLEFCPDSPLNKFELEDA